MEIALMSKDPVITLLDEMIAELDVELENCASARSTPCHRDDSRLKKAPDAVLIA
jgi:hypothetical protein